MADRAGVPSRQHAGWLLALVGLAVAVASAALASGAAAAAAAQSWPPFVLVSGLLLIGLVADEEGLFAFAGDGLARTTSSSRLLYAGAIVLTSAVTAVLNLDTSVAFLTPVLVNTARSRHESEAGLLYACLLVSNAASFVLPGANLTNLIVLGHLHMAGSTFVLRMAPACAAAVVVTAVVIAWSERLSPRPTVGGRADSDRPEWRPGVGLAAVLAATISILVLRSAAIVVAAIGVAAAGVAILRRRGRVGATLGAIGVPVLLGLFGLAVALGTIGRTWSGPAALLTHLDGWATAGLAAVTSVAVNNLPAASLLAARTPLPHPFALLVGLNLGPNLFVTGSLAWFLWLRAARRAGAQPSIYRASRIGLVAVPLSMVAALGVLSVSGLS